MDKLNAISIFCKVIETQSFTKAAALQNISVAMASKLVSQLEEQLKIRLLQRTTRKIVPTEAAIINVVSPFYWNWKRLNPTSAISLPPFMAI